MCRNAFEVLAAAAALAFAMPGFAYGADRAVLAGNHPLVTETMASVGNVDAAQPLTMEVRFTPRNEKDLEKLVADQQNSASPNYRKWLTHDEYEQRFGPRPADLKAVTAWLKSEGFTVESTADDYVAFAGTAAQAQRSFAVRIAKFGDGNTFANVNDPTIPAQFSGVISSITGLDNMTHAIPVAPRRVAPSKLRKTSSQEGGGSFRAAALRTGAPSGFSPDAIVNGDEAFGPADIRSFYDETVTSGRDGTGGCIAIVGTSDYLNAAISAFQNQFSLPAFQIARVVHGKSPGLNADEIEAEIDLEWSHAVAPGAIQRFHYGANLINDISGAINDKCDIVSISFSFCGPPSGYVSTVSTLMRKAAALGESVFASSGDQGAAGLNAACKTDNFRGVSELATDPNVTAVGGTQFAPNYDANGDNVGYSNNEEVWATSNGASGGGESQIFSKPSYQSGPGVPPGGMRDVPDVALISGVPGVFLGDDVGGSGSITCCWGGTSLAAPLWAGFTRVLSQLTGSRLGPMNPLIYQLANLQFGPQGSGSGFHDITVGNNGFNGVSGFNAASGYDQATGWGTIDFDVFAAAVGASKPTPTPGALKFPASVSFGNLKVGKPPGKKNLKLTNPRKNKIAAQISANAVLQAGTDFSIVASTCTAGSSIAAGKNCVVAVIFNPQTIGVKTDTLVFTDNASNSTQRVSLRGVGK